MGLSFLAPYNDFEKEINFTGTSTITNGNTQLVPLSTGLGLNVPTGGSHALSVNGTSALTVSAALATLDTTNGIYFTGTTGTVTGSQRMIVPTSTGININVPTGKYIVGSVNGVEVFHADDATGSGIIQLGASTSSARTYLYGDSAGILFNSPTGSTQDYLIAGTNRISLSASSWTLSTTNGAIFNQSGGTISGSSRQITGTSSGLSFNTPSSTVHTFRVNDVSVAVLTGTDWNIGTLGASGYSIRGNSLSQIVHNVPTGALHTFNVNNVTQASIDTTGLALFAGIGLVLNATGTVTAASRQVIGTSAGLEYNTPTGTAHILNINGAGCFSVQALVVALATTNGLKFNTSSGTATGGNREIVPASTGIIYNTPTGTSHILAINGTICIQFNSQTGGTKHFLRQSSAGGVVTSSTITANELTISGTADSTTFFRGDGVYSNALTGSLSVATSVDFTSTTTVTAANRQVVPTASGLELNTPAGTSHFFEVNGTPYTAIGATGVVFSTTNTTPSGSVLSLYRESAGSGGVTLNVAGSQYFNISTNNTFYHSFGSTGWILSGTQTSVGVGYASIFRDSSANINYHVASGSSHNHQINATIISQLTAAGFNLSATSGLFLLSSTGTISASFRQIAGTSVGITYSVPTGLEHRWAVNGSAIAQLFSTHLALTATNGIFINSNGGSALGSTSRQIWGNSGGLSIESVGTFYLYHAGVNTATFTASSGLTFAAARTSTPNTCSVCRDDVAGNMRFNVAFNGEYYIGHNGTTTFLTLSQTGIRLADGVEFTNLGKGNVFTSAGGTVATSSTTLVYNLNNKSGRIWFFDGNGGWAIFRFTAATGSVTREDGSAKWVASASPASDEAGVAVSGTSINLYMGSAASSAARRVGWHVFNMSHI